MTLVRGHAEAIVKVVVCKTTIGNVVLLDEILVSRVHLPPRHHLGVSITTLMVIANRIGVPQEEKALNTKQGAGTFAQSLRSNSYP